MMSAFIVITLLLAAAFSFTCFGGVLNEAWSHKDMPWFVMATMVVVGLAFLGAGFCAAIMFYGKRDIGL